MAKYAQGMTTSNEANGIQLLYDGDGLAVIGEPAAVENFLASEGLTSLSRLLPKVGEMIDGLGALSGTASTAVETVSSLKESAESLAGSVSSIVDSANAVTVSVASMAQTAGKWVKTSGEISQIVKKYRLSEAKTPGVLQAVVGQFDALKGIAPIITNAATSNMSPAVAAGPAGVMAQVAMEQAMAEILEYLKAIDRKLADVLRNQKNDVLARMDGVRLAIEEAMTIRDAVGRVSEITWSKIQNTSGIILETQSYALRQLEDLAIKIEESKTVADLTKTADELNEKVRLWVRVLADCFRLHDAIAVLELDRVLDASPDELDRHRMGLKAARQERTLVIGRATNLLLTRMNDATGTANSKVLFNPFQTKELVKTTNAVASDIQEFHVLLGIESGWTDTEARAWKDAANESWERTRGTGSEGVHAVKQIGKETRGQTQAFKGKLSGKIADRLPRKKNESEK